jgi:hypothetical protein
LTEKRKEVKKRGREGEREGGKEERRKEEKKEGMMGTGPDHQCRIALETKLGV